MKINMFVVSLLAMVKTMAVTFGMFFLLLLVYSDTLEFWNHGEDVFLYAFFGLFFYSMGCIAYVFSILLPIYFIDRKNLSQTSAHENIQRHAPVVTAVLFVFVGIAALIAGSEGGLSEGLVQANFFNVFVMAFSGLIFFEYQLKSAFDKNRNVPEINK